MIGALVELLELPQQLLEAAAIEADRRAHPRPTATAIRTVAEQMRRNDVAAIRNVIPAIAMARWGWLRTVVSPMPGDAITRIEGLSACLHLQRVDIDDELLTLDGSLHPARWIVALDQAAFEQRRCTCVPQPRPSGPDNDR